MSGPERSEGTGDGQMPIEVRVRWEIWDSFVSLLRSYAALAGTEYSVVNFGDWAKVAYKDRAVRFCFSPVTGEAVWRTIRPEIEAWGSFAIALDGTLRFSGEPQALDMAVIDWISWLGREELFDFDPSRSKPSGPPPAAVDPGPNS